MINALNTALVLMEDLLDCIVSMFSLTWVQILGLLVVCAFVISLFKRLTN